MATNTLNQIFSIEQQIAAKEQELKALKAEEKALLEKALTSGVTENRYYRIVSKVRKGDRVLDIVLLKEKYPTIYEQCKIESVKVTDAQKLLGDEVISSLSTRKADSVTYYVEKKASDMVVVL